MNGPFDDLIPGAKPAPGSLGKGFVFTPPADSLGQQQKAANLQETQLRNSQTAATAADNMRKAKADADLAELNEQEKRQQLLLQNGVPAPGDSTKTGAAYIATLPPGMRPQVISMIEGRTPYPTGAALKSPQVMAIVAAAQQADPTYNYSNAITRLKTRQDFTSGASAKNITAINTALGHLGQLMQDAGALKNTGSPMVNAPVNAVRSGVLGSGKFTALSGDVQAVADELERAFKGTNSTETGVKGWEQNFSPNSSPEQFLQGGQAVAKLLMGRLENLSDQYNRGMSRAADPMTFLNPHSQAVLQGVSNGNLSQIPSTLPAGWDKAPITASFLPGDSGPPPPPPGQDGHPPTLGGGPSHPDYSTMLGGPQAALATMDPNSEFGALKQTYRNEYDPVHAAALNALIHKGASFDEANAYVTGYGGSALDPAQYNAAVAYAKQPGHGNVNLVNATKTIPTTLGERLASSPGAALLAGGAAAATAGLSDVAGRELSPSFDANRAALAATNPRSDMLGNVIGGAAGLLGGNAILDAVAPGALGAVKGALGRFAPAAGDAAYGSIYGANEDPANPLGGAAEGGLAALLGGAGGRTLTRGAANLIAPTEGAFAPAYSQGVFPTIGQRFANSGFPGRAINTAEQAMQSMPGLGAMVARARDIPRDAAQIGAFNTMLGDLKPFDDLLPQPVSSLPEGTQPGPAAHAFTQQAFNQAYPIARSGMQLVPGDQFASDIAAFKSKWQPLLSGEQQKQLGSLINSSVGTRLKAGGGTMSGQAYQQAASDIGSAAQTWSKESPLLSQAASEYGSILDNAARASSDPQASALLDAADNAYAKYAGVIRPASARVGGDPGEFTMKAFDRAVQNNASGPDSSQYLRGNALMQDYANAIKPLGDVLSNSGTGERLLTNRLFLGEQGLGGAGVAASPLGGAILAHPGALAPFALYAPGINKAVTRLIAPRQYTLPPIIADPLNAAGAQVNGLAPLIGAGTVPLALTYTGAVQ